MIRIKINEDLSKTITLLSMISFLAIFLVIMFDHISSEVTVSLITAVISLILIRHLMGNILTFVQGVKYLYEHKHHINTIFFSGLHTQMLTDKVENDFLKLFEPEYYKIWLKDLLGELRQDNIEIEKYEWYELGIVNEIAIIVLAHDINKEQSQKYFIRVFNKNLNTKALKEAMLFEKTDLSKLSFHFVGSLPVRNFTCNVFEYEAFSMIEPKAFAEKNLEYKKKQFNFPLSSNIKRQYISTHQLIYDRMSKEVISKLGIAADDEEKLLLVAFEQLHEEIMQTLKQLPLQIVLPMSTNKLLVLDSSENLKLLSCSQWMIEPIGFGFSIFSIEQSYLKEMIVSMNMKDPINLKSVRIVSYLADMERNINRYNFKMALQDIKEILAIYSEIE